MAVCPRWYGTKVNVNSFLNFKSLKCYMVATTFSNTNHCALCPYQLLYQSSPLVKIKTEEQTQQFLLSSFIESHVHDSIDMAGVCTLQRDKKSIFAVAPLCICTWVESTAGFGNKDDVKHKKDYLVDWVLTSGWKTRGKNKFR